MWLDSIRKILGIQPRTKRNRGKRPDTQRHKARLQLEVLEDRITPSGATLSISALDAIKPEGNIGTTPFTFTVSRSSSSGTASVSYAVTGSGTNQANATDFGGTFPSGTVSFTNGQASKVLTINV